VGVCLTDVRQVKTSQYFYGRFRNTPGQVTEEK
jgi:hypothetical protein